MTGTAVNDPALGEYPTLPWAGSVTTNCVSADLPTGEPLAAVA